MITNDDYILGAINNLITPLSYISKVENVTVTGGGADDEEAENLRESLALCNDFTLREIFYLFDKNIFCSFSPSIGYTWSCIPLLL